MNSPFPLLHLAIFGIAVIGAAGGVLLLGRKLSAARRHLIWVLAFVILAIGSPLALWGVRFAIPVLPAKVESEVPVAAVVRSDEPKEEVAPSGSATSLQFSEETKEVVAASLPAASRFDVLPWVYGIWALGFVVILARVGLGILYLRRLRKNGTPLGRVDGEGRLSHGSAGVSVVCSRRVQVPFVSGVFAPVIFVPEAAVNWRPGEWTAAIQHELSHVRRGDVTALLLSQIVIGMHWFNPLMWLALACLRQQAEQAADNEAASSHATAEEYAENLLRVVRNLAGQGSVLLPAMCMAHESDLTQRISQLLDLRRDRSSPSRPWSRGLVVCAATLVAGGFLLKPVAAQRPETPAETDYSEVPRSEEPLVVVCKDERGEPVADAEVYFSEQPYRVSMYQDAFGIPWLDRPAARTNEKGEVKIDHPMLIKGGKYSRMIYVRGPGGLAGGKYFSDEYSPLKANRAELTLFASETLKGRVELKGESQPIKVRLLLATDPSNAIEFGRLTESSSTQKRFFETTADAGGNFELEAIPKKANVYLEATAPGYGWSQLIHMATQQTPPFLVLETEAVIEGTVTNEMGQPVQSARVEAISHGPVSMRIPYTATTDPFGRYRIAGLQGSTYAVKLAWTSTTRAPEAEVSIRAGETKTVDLVQERGVEVSGVVTSGGAGIPDVMISAVAGDIGGEGVDSAITDAQGRYTLRLPSGKSMLYVASLPDGFVYPEDQARRTVTVTSGEVVAGETAFELAGKTPTRELLRPARARGRVLDQEGKPKGDLLISLSTKPLPGEPGGQLTSPSGRTKADGTYDISLSPNARYTVRVGGETESTAKSKEFTALPGSEHEIEDLTVRPANGRASGIVVDEAGTPLANVAVNPASPGKYAWKANEVVTDSQGRFAVSNILEDEVLQLSVSKSGYFLRIIEGISPNATDIRIMLHEASSYDVPIERLAEGSRLIEKPAPEITTGLWIQGADKLPKYPRKDGRWTLVSFLGVDETTGARLGELEKLASAGKIEPIGIFHYNVDEHYPRALLKKVPVGFPLAIDRYLPGRSESTMAGATRVAFGNDRFYLIDPHGIVRAVFRKLSDVQIPSQ